MSSGNVRLNLQSRTKAKLPACGAYNTRPVCSPHLSGNVCLIIALGGVRGKSAVPRTVLAPLTGPQVNVLGIHF